MGSGITLTIAGVTKRITRAIPNMRVIIEKNSARPLFQSDAIRVFTIKDSTKKIDKPLQKLISHGFISMVHLVFDFTETGLASPVGERVRLAHLPIENTTRQAPNGNPEI